MTKILDTDPKAIQQTELVGQLKNLGNDIFDNQYAFIINILEKIEEKRLNYFLGSVTVFKILQIINKQKLN